MPRMTHPDLPDTQEPFEAPVIAVEHWQSLGWELLDGSQDQDAPDVDTSDDEDDEDDDEDDDDSA